MKYFLHFFITTCTVALLAAACNKVADLPYYGTGAQTVLSSSETEINPTPADSASIAVTFSWSNPNYAVDSSAVKYQLQIDSAGKNFSHALTRQFTGQRQVSFTAEEWNNILVGFGFAFNTPHSVEVRIISSYINNNNLKYSNVLTLTTMPYAVPFSLQSAGSGPYNITLQNKDDVLQTFSWHAPSYGGASLGYTLQYDLAGNNFANARSVPTTSDTSAVITGSTLNSYAMESGIQPNQQGELEFRVAVTVNGTQTAYSDTQSLQVTPAILVAYLYVAGDYQGWNPGTAPAIASTDGVAFEGYVNLTSTGGFKFTSQQNWNGTNYGDGGAGKLSADGSAGNLNVPQAGYYLLKANTSALTWSATLTDWGIIGSATPNGWGSSTALKLDAATNTWQGTVSLTAGEFKFRANESWDINLGGDPTHLSYGGDNLQLSEAGNYKVVLNLTNPLAFTYTLTKL